MFQDNCKIWKRKPDVDKTWTQFKIDFAIAHSELVESPQKAHYSGFQANNATEVQRDTAAAVSNLVNTTQAGCAPMVALTTIITTLTTSLKEANNKLVTSLACITFLEKDLATIKGKQTSPTVKTFTCTHYYHSHDPKCGHPSKECHKKLSGHKDKANDPSRMAGAPRTLANMVAT